MINKTVCLNMIVKDESEVIQRCLKSVQNFIDYWVIVDTGSTDQTIEIIQECLKDIPGKLYERPWVDFEYNRNEALALAKNGSGYLLFLDADESLIISDSTRWPILEKDFYLAVCDNGNTHTRRILLVDQTLAWKWSGQIHEVISSSQAINSQLLKGITIDASHYDGNRSKNLKEKFHSDTKVLKKALHKEPTNSRYLFHLAFTYDTIHEYQLALKCYEKRIMMGGFEKEVYFSYYRVGVMQENLEMHPDIFIRSYLRAYRYNPDRIEPLYCLTNYYIKIRCYILGYFLSQYTRTRSRDMELYLCDVGIYEYGILNQFAECSFRLGKFREAYDALTQLLTVSNLPTDIRQGSEKNLSLPVFDEFR